MERSQEDRLREIDQKCCGRLHELDMAISDIRKNVALIDDRQSRMHSDINNLCEALEETTKQIMMLNSFVSNRKGFAAGAISVITLFGGAVGAVVWAVLEWLAPA